MDSPKLSFELVPSTCFCSNVRSEVSEQQWDSLKRETARLAGNKCEICGGRGPRWAVECHEVWFYDDEKKIQFLVGLISLCPSCHQVKHFGHAGIIGKQEEAFEHLKKINEWDDATARKHIKFWIKKWTERSQHQWELNLGFLKWMYGIDVTPKRGTSSKDD